MKHNPKLKLFFQIVAAALFILSFTVAAYADMGPKDELIVYVVNPPDELYYLDLLTEKTIKYDNFPEDGRSHLNESMIKLLYSFEDEGWKPALAEGTGVPMWGNLVGETKGEEMIHKFGYVGLPDTYRIVIVTESGKVSVTEPYTRKSLQSSISYDYSSKDVKIPPVWLAYVLQYLTTIVPTLAIEGIILVMFKFKIEENWKVFLMVNLITQLLLTLTLGVTLIQRGTVTAYFTQFPAEIFILTVETVIYGRLLKGDSIKRYFYGITANIASWTIGFFFLSYQFQFLMSILT